MITEYIIHYRDSLDDIKHKINFVTFQDDDYDGGDSGGFLRYQLEDIDGEDYYNKEYRVQNHHMEKIL